MVFVILNNTNILNSTHKKNRDKDGKAFCKLMNNVVDEKTTEKLRNRIDVKLVNSEKDYLKCTLKPSYMSHKIFDKSLINLIKV